jgi:enterochelin esterase-like enzyme
VQKIVYVRSAAIGGHEEPLYVFLPPGYYQHPKERYPVYYALHGTPGEPFDFDQVLDMGVTENVLVAEHKIRPMILVSPMGAFSPFADDEWANGVRKGTDWETYVARDVVRAVDHLYRTIPDGADRAIAGLSEGGYGALNISIHHPGEFRVVESWSGYALADYVPAVWGPHPSRRLMAFNSPDLQVRYVAPILRRDHTYFWFYCGSDDPLVTQNIQFARTLHDLKLPYDFQIRRGGHSWKLWRSMVDEALVTASEHFGRG